jgi:hypothetical protein
MVSGKGGRLVATLVLVCALVGLALGTSGASASTGALKTHYAVCDTGHVYFAKTKFVFHAGLAFGVFHRYIYKPFKAGAFRSGSSGRVKAAIKAALAAAFVYHELKLACRDANNSSLLRPLLTPLNAGVGMFAALENKLKGGEFSDATFTSAASAVDGLGSKSSGLGLSIPDLVTGFSGG